MFKRTLLTALALTLGASTAYAADPAAGLPVEKATLTDAPNVPPPITRKTPAKVVAELDVVEVVDQLADGVKYTKWTFGGKVPGKFIRVRQGDTVEFTLRNLTQNMMPHNIDLHAVTGPGGGAKVTLISPGNQSTFQWKALKPGIYVYHCATAPVPMHLSNGMYGLILVEPEKGLPKVDHEYYIMQSEFYTQRAEPQPDAAQAYTGAGKPGVSRGDLYEFSVEKMLAETPDYVVWNGRVGSLTGPGALKAKTGETVRFFVGNAGLNLISSFHIIGDHLERVYDQGSLDSPPLLNIQNTLIPAGAAAMVETTFEVPGDYPLLDHSLGRAFNKGGVGMISVAGDQRADIYQFMTAHAIGDSSKTANADEHSAKPANLPASLTPAQKDKLAMCAACHDVGPSRKKLVGPPLWGVFGKKPTIAGVPFGKWDENSLDKWLNNAPSIKAATMMTYRVPDAKERKTIIDILKELH
jgi:nitrite reductase (NO-forming)